MDNEIERISMKMILHAGDGRLKLQEAIELTKEFKFEEAEKKIEEAEVEIKLAHKEQTQVIQKQAQGTEYGYSILFAHAQDTVMSVNSEALLINNILSLTKELYKKIERKV